MRLPFCLFCLFLAAPAASKALNVKSCAPEPGVTDVSYGDLVKCQIDIVGDSDLFRFQGQAGEVIRSKSLRDTAVSRKVNVDHFSGLALEPKQVESPTMSIWHLTRSP